MAKPRLQKKAPVKQVEQTKSSFNLIEFYTKYRDFIGYALVGVVIIAALVSLMVLNQRSKEKEASQKFQDAITLMKSELSEDKNKDKTADQDKKEATTKPETSTDKTTDKTTSSINAFQEIADNYSSTASGRNSVFLLASSQLSNGNYQDAIQNFNKFQEQNPDNPLIPSCLMGIATAEFNLKQVNESLQMLDSIITKYPDFSMMDVVKFEIGKRHEAMSNWDKAREFYQEVIDKYPDSPWKSFCSKKIEKLNKEHPLPEKGTPSGEKQDQK
jgi:TolA-binding protein